VIAREWMFLGPSGAVAGLAAASASDPLSPARLT
jgi:hypothetical protein